MCWIIKPIRLKFAVGYFNLDGTFYCFEEFEDINQAKEMCHYLNGGSLYS